jgi:hypothetical protein
MDALIAVWSPRTSIQRWTGSSMGDARGSPGTLFPSALNRDVRGVSRRINDRSDFVRLDDVVGPTKWLPPATCRGNLTKVATRCALACKELA